MPARVPKITNRFPRALFGAAGSQGSERDGKGSGRPPLPFERMRWRKLQRENRAASATGIVDREWLLRTEFEASTGTETKMKRRTYCVYNQTRECFISLGVTPADTTFARLRGLIGRLELKFDDGVWVVPSRGIHTLGVLFPLDLIYLDANNRVLHLIEHFPPFRIAPLRAQAASVLELPTHTIYSSQTQTGDQLLICAAEEMERHLSRGPVEQWDAQSK